MDIAIENFLKYVENQLALVYDADAALGKMPIGDEKEVEALEAATTAFHDLIVTTKANIETASQNMAAAISASNTAALEAAVKDAYDKTTTAVTAKLEAEYKAKAEEETDKKAAEVVANKEEEAMTKAPTKEKVPQSAA